MVKNGVQKAKSVMKDRATTLKIILRLLMTGLYTLQQISRLLSLLEDAGMVMR